MSPLDPPPLFQGWASPEAVRLRRWSYVTRSTFATLGVLAAAFLVAAAIRLVKDRRALTSVHVGMHEAEVLRRAGAPSSHQGPPLLASARPSASDCPGQEPCHPQGVVRSALYQRTFFTSLEVYYDESGVVQCIERPLVADMSFGATW